MSTQDALLENINIKLLLIRSKTIVYRYDDNHNNGNNTFKYWSTLAQHSFNSIRLFARRLIKINKINSGVPLLQEGAFF